MSFQNENKLKVNFYFVKLYDLLLLLLIIFIYFRSSDMLAEDNDPIKPTVVLDSIHSITTTGASLHHLRNVNNGKYIAKYLCI